MTDTKKPRASSEPTADAFDQDDHFTPITDVLEGEEFIPTERERRLLTIIWRHTANMEMRGRRRSDSQDSAQLARRIDDLETAVVDTVGKSGENGKLGKTNERVDTLKERVDKTESRRWTVIMAAISLAIAVIGSAFVLYRWIGNVETDVEWLKQRSFISQPVDPAKESP